MEETTFAETPLKQNGNVMSSGNYGATQSYDREDPLSQLESDEKVRRPPSQISLNIGDNLSSRSGKMDTSLTVSEEAPLLGPRHRSGDTLSKSMDTVPRDQESIAEDEDEEKLDPTFKEKYCTPLRAINRFKSLILLAFVVVFTVMYAAAPDFNYQWRQFSVSKLQVDDFYVNNTEYDDPIIKIYISASVLFTAPSRFSDNLQITITNLRTKETESWKVVVPHPSDAIRIEPSITMFKSHFANQSVGDQYNVRLNSSTTFSIPGEISINEMPAYVDDSVIFAAIILIGVYILIIFELVHRTIAAMIGSTAALAIMAVLNEKPDMDTILTWLDYDTLALLFGMMVMVAILCETGFFDWVALMAYKIAKGKTWPLITTLCAFSAVISAFLDNVTTILLLSPVTIRLCEVLDIDPKHVLMAEVMFSNIGGTATGIGDPPNVIILSDKSIMGLGINFGTFTLHMTFGSIFAAIGAYALLRFMYRRKELLRSKYPPEVAAIKNEIEIWRRACNTIVVASREESTVKALLNQKVATLEHTMKQALYDHRQSSARGFKIQVQELAKIYYIRDKPLLVKCLVVLVVVIIGFFLDSFIDGMHLTVGWIPILGSIWLLVWSDFKDLESILHRVEWSTLLFFAALFVMMEALEKLELITFITEQLTALVKMIPEDSRLTVAIILILWSSALCSSFIDNIPYTTAMIPVVVKLSGDPDVNLPLEPLVWSLAFGACLGGNGTLIGASANVVCAGIAETHGHGFSFSEFFKVGFPMMVLTVLIAMIYLLICHVAFTWHAV